MIFATNAKAIAEKEGEPASYAFFEAYKDKLNDMIVEAAVKAQTKLEIPVPTKHSGIFKKCLEIYGYVVNLPGKSLDGDEVLEISW